MQMMIHTHGLELTEALKRHTYEKLGLALDRLEDNVRKISIDMSNHVSTLTLTSDVTCRIVVYLDNTSLEIEDHDERVDMALDRATDRLGVIASQHIDAVRRKNSRVS